MKPEERFFVWLFYGSLALFGTVLAIAGAAVIWQATR